MRTSVWRELAISPWTDEREIRRYRKLQSQVKAGEKYHELIKRNP